MKLGMRAEYSVPFGMLPFKRSPGASSPRLKCHVTRFLTQAKGE